MKKLLSIAVAAVLTLIAASLSARAQTVPRAATVTRTQVVVATPVKSAPAMKNEVRPRKAQNPIIAAPDVVPAHTQKLYVASSASVVKPLQPPTDRASAKMKDEK